MIARIDPPRALAALSLSLVLSLVAVGCGGASPEPVAPTAQRERPPAPAVVSSPDTIDRASLDAVLAEGPGAFLARVAVEPDVHDGHFVGFRITELRDPALFAASEVRAGDTIVSINGHAIERPDEAFEVWTSLRVASELSIRLVRDGEAMELRYPIVD